MKGLFVFICAVIVNANAQCNCGCSSLTPRRPLSPLPPCRPSPPCPRPASPCPRPLPLCPRPAPLVPRPPCPKPYPVPLPKPCDCPRAVEICQPLSPAFQSPILSPPILQAPVVSYEAVTPYSPVALPSCNCPAPPTLPVSQLYPSFPGLCPLGLGVSPCLGGLPDFSVPVPTGLINPFLPAASPLSALAPTVSSLYPPINPCNCGCNFLKKIPIPPPCL